MDYYLNIGSNMGDRRDNLYRAVVALTAGRKHFAVSSIVESEPWGFESENGFLNVGLKLKFKKFSLQNMNLQWKICDFIQALT